MLKPYKPCKLRNNCDDNTLAAYSKKIVAMVFLVFSILCQTLLLLFVQATSAQEHNEAKVAEKPNILFLLTDDQAAWAVGYKNPEFLTPEIDKLAAEGMVFNNHYNTTAICMASRANIMTGMLEYKTGTNFDHGDMSAEIFAKTYPQLLQQAGYYTDLWC